MLPDGGNNGRGHTRTADAVGSAEVGVGLASAGATADRLLQDADPWILKAAKAGGKEWITQYDQNKDGKVTENEFTSSELQKLTKAREQYSGDHSRALMLADSNNDNKLTMSELTKKIGAKAANSIMKDGDKNHDGFLDFGEANKLFGKQFDEDEKMRLHWQFQEFDRNGSGVATADEASKAVEARLRSPGFIPSPAGDATMQAGGATGSGAGQQGGPGPGVGIDAGAPPPKRHKP